MQYRSEIDGLRALAVLPVVLYHAHAVGFAGGFAGVDVFFVISGYLITSIIYGELLADNFSIVLFYERRIRRLLPALFLVLATTLAFSVMWLSPGAARDFFKSLFAVPLFGSNLYFASTTGYFSGAAELKPLLHTWTLAVEEQYYLFFPVFMLMAWRLAPRKVTILIAIGVLLSLGFSILYTAHAPNRAFFSMPSRCWELLMGAMAALHLQRFPHRTPADWKCQAGSLLGLLLTAVVMVFKAPVSVPGYYSLLPTVGTALIILFAWPGTIAHALLSTRPMLAVGTISYSLYLWHQPLMALARTRFIDTDDTALMLVAVPASMILAYLSWRFVEVPFRERQRIPIRPIVLAAAAGSVFFVGLGGAMVHFDYATLRYGAERAAMYRNMPIAPEHDCQQDIGDTRAVECVLGAATSARTLAVIGDSHASQWGDALHRLGRDNDLRISVFAKGACAAANVHYWYYALRRDYWECTEWRKDVVERIKAGHFDAILITTSSAGYAGADHLVTPVEWKEGVRTFVQQIQPHTRQLIWLIDNPRYATNPFLCFEANFWHGDGRECAVPRQKAVNEQLIDFERTALADLPKVTVADFNDFYCDTDRCLTMKGNEPLMRDSNHLTAKATLLLQPRLASLIKTAF